MRSLTIATSCVVSLLLLCNGIVDGIRNGATVDKLEITFPEHTNAAETHAADLHSGIPADVPYGAHRGRLPTIADGCGRFKAPYRSKAIYVQRSTKELFPFLVQLGYAETAEDQLQFLCSGSLITEQHVLTAATCITSALRSIRLGQINRLDSLEYTIDGPSHIDRYVAATRLHPQFAEVPQLRHNIAVLQMDTAVQFAPHIWPICLPTAEPQRTRNFTGYHPFTVGWWTTVRDMPGNEQLLDLPRMVEENCPPEAAAVPTSVICVQSAYQEGPCIEAGAPLVQPQTMRLLDDDDVGNIRLFLTGIGSFGLHCELEKAQGYTKVQDYVDWIEASL